MDYVKLVRLFLPEAIGGVLDSRQNSHCRLVEKLQELEFVTQNVTETPSEITIELQVLDDQLLYRLLSGEANKFLLASMVSCNRAFQKQDNNAAWQAVEHYYAAYYAIHYLLRITGVSLTNLDSVATNTIVRNQLKTKRVNVVPSGLYTLTYNNESKIVSLKKKLNKSSGGSHQDAWQLWEELIVKLQKNAEVDLAEYIGVSVDLSEHKKFLIKSTGRYTPPEVRGEINYQFKGGHGFSRKIHSSQFVDCNLQLQNHLFLLLAHW